jgi:Tfp pilus assembly protein PilW
MTTSTPHTDRRGRRAAFSLTEVIVAATLSGFVLAAVLSAFVFLGRTGFRAGGYAELEGEVRRGLETFARDARAATDIRWNSAQSITLTLPAGSSPAQVTYAYDADAASATARSFYRLAGDAASTLPRRALIRQVAPDFTFRRYKLEQAGVTDNAAASDLETKQIQVVLRAERASLATAGAGQNAVSARYILRNKRVAN